MARNTIGAPNPPGASPAPIAGVWGVNNDDVELRRSSRVQSSDGHDLGHVEALVVDDQNGVTHFVLQHRRLLGGRRNTTIPVKEITKIETDVVTVGLARAQVRALPAERAQRR